MFIVYTTCTTIPGYNWSGDDDVDDGYDDNDGGDDHDIT